MKLSVLLISLLCFSSSLYANDSAAVRIGGRLEFKKSQAITLLSEDLLISPGKVKVNYSFMNETAQDIEELIAFPIQEEMYWESENVDLSEFVKQINFRLNSSEAVSDIKHEASFSKDYVAKVVFYWTQKFPAGKVVKVSHEYQAAGGFITPKSFNEWGNDWNAVTQEYCIEPGLNQWIINKGLWTNEVHYILTTGANWKRPIQHFKLTIKKENPAQKVSLCMNNIKKINETTFQVEQNNFVPEHDLKILFINPPAE